MKGFKPSGFGPKAGFDFSPKMGFTGSSGMMTHVSPYVRKTAFASGGAVRGQRMTTTDVGDVGSALVRRTRPFSEQEREAGGRNPLRPGFKDGGKNWIKGAIKHPGALHKALGVPEGKKIPAKKLAKAAHSDNPTMRRRAALAKTLGKMKKADGGKVVYGSSSKGFLSDVSKIPEAIKEALRAAAPSSGMARGAADRVSGRQRQVDTAVDEAVTGRSKPMASNFGRGGKIMATRYSMGGKTKASKYAKGGAIYRTRQKGGSRRGMMCAEGGMAHSDEAQDKKMIGAALKKHVNTPAPKGHKGLGAMCK